LNEQSTLAIYRFAEESLAFLLRDTVGQEFEIDLHRNSFTTILVLRSMGTVDRKHTDAPMDAQAAEVLHHRAHMMGGQLKIDATRSRTGWLGLQLTLPLDRNLAATEARKGDAHE
jgi:hypothetical protein